MPPGGENAAGGTAAALEDNEHDQHATRPGLEQTSCLDAALSYARRGWYVIPVWWTDGEACGCGRRPCDQSPGKHPLGDLVPSGQHGATTDEVTIRRWFARYPRANIGIVLDRSGLMALDIDGTDYEGKIYALQSHHGELPDTVTQRSGSGAFHGLYKRPEFPIRGEIGGITLRGRNYVVAAPSLHASGGRYEWVAGRGPDEVAVSPLPPAWLEAIRKDESSAAPVLDGGNTIPDGRRNSTLTSIAGSMRRRGLERDEILAALLVTNRKRCNPPLPEDEVERVASSVSRYAAETDAVEDARNLEALASIGLGPIAPTRDELDAHLKSELAKLRRSTKQHKILAGTVLGRVLKRDHRLAGDDEDPAHGLATAASALVTHAPNGASDAQLATLLISCGINTGDATAAIAAARTTPITSIAGRVTRSVAGASEPATDAALRARLIPGKDGVGTKACGSNIEMILRYASELHGSVRFNELTKEVEVTAGRFTGEHPNGLDVAIKNWLETEWELFASTTQVGEQLLRAARTWGSYDPVREYLDGLVWDGTPRIDGWLRTYCNAEPTAYVDRVSAMFLIAACARALEPGSKVDTVLTLEGSQGVKKSTAVEILGGAWFSDTPLVLGDKDSYLITGSTWVVELAELASLSGREVEKHKAFLSAKSDKFRPPYGRVPETFNRRCVFVGTTNASEYLTDDTGNRRHWCVRVSAINVDAMRRDRDQLWAEAAHRYRAGERWWFEAAEQREADAVAGDREVEDPWVGLIRAWVARGGTELTRFTLADAATQALKIDVSDLKRHEANIARSLRRAGYTRGKNPETHDGVRARFWQRK